MLSVRSEKDFISYIKSINSALWSGENWISGTKVIKGIDDYLTLKATAYSSLVPIIFHRVSDNKFVGIGIAGNSSGQWTYYITLTKTDTDMWDITSNMVVHSVSGNHSALNNNYGIIDLTGIIPKWGGGLLKALSARLSAVERRWSYANRQIFKKIRRTGLYKNWQVGDPLDASTARIWIRHSMGRRILSSLYEWYRFPERFIHGHTIRFLHETRCRISLICWPNNHKGCMCSVFIQLISGNHNTQNKSGHISYRSLEVITSPKGGVFYVA